MTKYKGLERQMVYLVLREFQFWDHNQFLSRCINNNEPNLFNSDQMSRNSLKKKTCDGNAFRPCWHLKNGNAKLLAHLIFVTQTKMKWKQVCRWELFGKQNLWLRMRVFFLTHFYSLSRFYSATPWRFRRKCTFIVQFSLELSLQSISVRFHVPLRLFKVTPPTERSDILRQCHGYNRSIVCLLKQ